MTHQNFNFLLQHQEQPPKKGLTQLNGPLSKTCQRQINYNH
jgi:hypothetical protein